MPGTASNCEWEPDGYNESLVRVSIGSRPARRLGVARAPSGNTECANVCANFRRLSCTFLTLRLCILHT
jgi:hypothetical protein